MWKKRLQYYYQCNIYTINQKLKLIQYCYQFIKKKCLLLFCWCILNEDTLVMSPYVRHPSHAKVWPFPRQQKYLIHSSKHTLRPRLLVWPWESHPWPSNLQSSKLPTELILLLFHKSCWIHATIAWLSICTSYTTHTYNTLWSCWGVLGGGGGQGVKGFPPATISMTLPPSHMYFQELLW